MKVDDQQSLTNDTVLSQVQNIFGHLLESQTQFYKPEGFWKTFKLWGEPVRTTCSKCLWYDVVENRERTQIRTSNFLLKTVLVSYNVVFVFPLIILKIHWLKHKSRDYPWRRILVLKTLDIRFSTRTRIVKLIAS